MNYLFRFILFSLLWFASLSAQALTTDWDVHQESQARLVIASYGDAAQAGLEITLADKWKSYWRTPGDGGVEPKITWDGSSNVEQVIIHWPAPTRYVDYGDIESYGYSNRVIYPLSIVPADASQPIDLTAQVTYAVCEATCIFEQSEFSLQISPSYTSEAMTHAIAPFVAQIAGGNGEHGMMIREIQANAERLVITTTSTDGFTDPDMFIEAGANFRFPKPERQVSENDTVATFTFDYGRLLASASLEDQPIRFTLVDNKQAVELERSITLSSADANEATSAGSPLLYILFAAFLGGLILNIMPCVLPVLSLKVMEVVKQGGRSRSEIRRSFLVSCLGILSSFLVLAGIVISLRYGGHHVGWGFHFQEPLFLIFLLFLLVLFAANQWGLFELQLSSGMSQRVNKLLGGADHSHDVSSFLTGALATILATPCSAPFLGTAVSFALSQEAWHIALIFTVMGMGLAFPYFMFSLAPGLVDRMPKPGAWMVRAKHILGVLLAVTAIWLLWIVDTQLGRESAAYLTIASLFILVALAIRKTLGGLTVPMIALLAVGGTAIALDSADEQPIAPVTIDDVWIPFNEAEIGNYVAAGKVVFVDVTADWCITCKWNKLNVLSSGDVNKTLRSDGVIAMQADFTSPSQEISNYLAKHGRYGIPFNIVYGPAVTEGIALPELLSRDKVMDALEAAR